MFHEFQQIVQSPDQYARDWKARTKGKVIGYFCSYVPEEIIYAAGILPVRVLSSLEPEKESAAHIASMYCPFSRGVIGRLLSGGYEYLDGVIIARTCQQNLQAFESYVAEMETRGKSLFHYQVGMPMLTGPEARKRFGTKPKDFLIAELKDFKASLENWSGSRISEEALDRSIEVYNTNRRLLRQLWKLRRNDPPPFSGTEAMQISLSMMLMDKAAGNTLLKNLIEQLATRQNGPKSGTRLMIAGGENWDIRILALVESLGANVVVDDLCMGSRYFWNEIIPEKDRLAAIAARYLDRPPCPTTDVVERRRIAHISSLIEEYNVQGVWLIQQKFCDPHEFDNVAIASFLDSRGVPNYTSELDTTVAEGQLKIRLQAFLEMLGGELFY